MINIETARPTASQMLDNINEIEAFLMGKRKFSPTKFREINADLSVGAVLMLGKRRYEKSAEGRRLFWQGLDEHEHDMGLVHDANITRNYPGFKAKASRSLGGSHVLNNKIITAPNGKGSLSIVTMQDGSEGIGPNYKIALRNAALKMHLKSQFNCLSLASLWNKILGNA